MSNGYCQTGYCQYVRSRLRYCTASARCFELTPSERVQIRDGARDFKNPVMRARAQAHAAHGQFERALAGGVQLAQFA